MCIAFWMMSLKLLGFLELPLRDGKISDLVRLISMERRAEMIDIAVKFVRRMGGSYSLRP